MLRLFSIFGASLKWVNAIGRQQKSRPTRFNKSVFNLERNTFAIVDKSSWQVSRWWWGCERGLPSGATQASLSPPTPSKFSLSTLSSFLVKILLLIFLKSFLILIIILLPTCAISVTYPKPDPELLLLHITIIFTPPQESSLVVNLLPPQYLSPPSCCSPCLH